jgi:threonylcarbamoyladenosine tRNA methylthiotransferase MtaB
VIFGKGPDGNDRSESFFELVQALEEVKGYSSFPDFISSKPNLLTNDIIDFVANSKRFMPHFHIPLQSGSNKILGTMRRRYKRELYAERVAHIKSVMPHAAIGVDVIVGFPGGNKRESLMKHINFSMNSTFHTSMCLPIRNAMIHMH